METQTPTDGQRIVKRPSTIEGDLVGYPVRQRETAVNPASNCRACAPTAQPAVFALLRTPPSRSLRVSQCGNSWSLQQIFAEGSTD
jgi:hypothetical protein